MSVPGKTEHRNWEKIRFSRLLWEFGSLRVSFVDDTCTCNSKCQDHFTFMAFKRFLGKLDV